MSREEVSTCPICGRDKLYRNSSTGKAYCFFCGEARTREAKALLGNQRSPGFKALPTRKERGPTWRDVDVFPPLLRYLRSRQVDRSEARELGIKGRLDHDWYSLGFHANGVLVTERLVKTSGGAWSRRWEKYDRHPKGSNQVLVYPAKMGTLVFVEGPFDAIRVWQAGYSACALLGNSLGEKKADIVIGHVERLDPRRVWVLLDSDAESHALRVTYFLQRNGIPARNATESLSALGKKDPGECTPEEIGHVLTQRA